MATPKDKKCPACGASVPALQLSELASTCAIEALSRGSAVLAAAEIVSLGEASQEQAEAWIKHLQSCIRSYPFSPETQDALAEVDEAFAPVKKPAHFTDYTHCSECREHDQVLTGATRETISREALGGSGWDPMCFVDGHGFAYYFPAMARYALAPELWGRDAYYAQLLFHLSYEKAANRHLQWFSPRQREAAVAVMERLREKTDMSDYEKQQLERTIEIWRA